MATTERRASQRAHHLLSMKVRRCSDVLGGDAHLAQSCGVDREQLATPPAEAVRAIVDLEFIIARAQMV